MGRFCDRRFFFVFFVSFVVLAFVVDLFVVFTVVEAAVRRVARSEEFVFVARA